MATLHCIYDPYCGWCHGAAPLMCAARALPGLALVLHGGGMLAGTRRRLVSPQWRSYVMPHDQRIARLTGQPFGDAYVNGLLREDGALFDSGPPTAAVRAAEFMGGHGVELLTSLQHAHFVAGRRISDPAVLRGLAGGLGLEERAFERALQAYSGAALEQHYRDTERLMAQAGGRGFPTFLLETADGVARLDHVPFLGRPEGFAQLLLERLGAAALSA
jgi:putative protein-disulfide isomerase